MTMVKSGSNVYRKLEDAFYNDSYICVSALFIYKVMFIHDFLHWMMQEA